MRYLVVNSQGNIAFYCGKQLPMEIAGNCLVLKDSFCKCRRG